jgi:hypothetical protein
VNSNKIVLVLSFFLIELKQLWFVWLLTAFWFDGLLHCAVRCTHMASNVLAWLH